MQYDIFISYSRKDRIIVDKYVQQLESLGYKVWIDRVGIYSGAQFKSALVQAIEESKVFVFFSSVASNDSKWTAKEIAIAINRNKHIFPIKLDNSHYNKDVEFDLVNLDFVNLSQKETETEEFEKLKRSLKNCIQPVSANTISSLENEKTNNIAKIISNINPFHPLINSAITFQLVLFVIFFLTFCWTLVFGCLAFYNNPQPSLFFLCAFLFLSVLATYKLKTLKSIWIGILAASDFFIVFYLCTIADFLYKNWDRLSNYSSSLPSSIRYRLLYFLGQDLGNHNFWGMHSYLLILVFIHICLMCLFLCLKKDGKSGWEHFK